MSQIIDYLRYRWLLWQWKRRARKKRRANVKVGSLRNFFQRLHQEDIVYVVLRWPEEIPWDSQALPKNDERDLDMLVRDQDLERFCRVAANSPGRTKIDLYSNGIRLGTDIKRLPYYPPSLGTEILAGRRLDEAAQVFVPSGRAAALSLAYHAVYHKGFDSGMPFAAGEKPRRVAKHDYIGRIKAFADTADLVLPPEFTLVALHEWLKTQGWAMPYDLLERWPVRHEGLEMLLQRETQLLQAMLQAAGLQDLLVFLLREDAIEAGAGEMILQELSGQFQILGQERLSQQQQRLVSRMTRGGDWTLHKSTQVIPPVLAVFCHDPCPEPVPADSPSAKLHPHVRNNRIFFKHRLRQNLSTRFPGANNFMHGSDNDCESCQYVQAIYGDNTLAILQQWHSQIAAG